MILTGCPIDKNLTFKITQKNSTQNQLKETIFKLSFLMGTMLIVMVCIRIISYPEAEMINICLIFIFFYIYILIKKYLPTNLIISWFVYIFLHFLSVFPSSFLKVFTRENYYTRIIKIIPSWRLCQCGEMVNEFVLQINLLINFLAHWKVMKGKVSNFANWVQHATPNDLLWI